MYKKILFIAIGIGIFFTSPVIALFLGICFAIFLGNPFAVQTKKISKKLLQLSVIGLGFGMNLFESLESGRSGMLITVVSVFGVMILGMALGKILKLNKTISYLVATGTAICGGSAIAAVSPITNSSDSEISISLGTVFILNAIALFIFPPLGKALGMTAHQFGTWAAIAIHDTSSVVGAGAAFNEEALKVATTVKLTRALWIIPLTILTMFIYKSDSKKIKIPWFIFLFILAMILNTFINIPSEITHGIVWLAKKALIVTLYLIGADLSINAIKTVGVRPMVLGVLLWVIISVSSLLVIFYGHMA